MYTIERHKRSIYHRFAVIKQTGDLQTAIGLAVTLRAKDRKTL